VKEKDHTAVEIETGKRKTEKKTEKLEMTPI
jgi:hypothetical protein